MIDYSQSTHQPRWQVAGQTLQPYCIGHALLLQRLENPFAANTVDAAVTAGLGDLAEAITVCRYPHRQAEKIVGQSYVRLRFRYCLLAHRLVVPKLREDALAGLYAYLLQAWTGPKTWQGAQRTRGNTADALANLIYFYRTAFRASYQETLDVPVRQAIYDVMLHLAQEGKLELVDSADDDLIAAAKRLRQQLKNAPKS